MSDRVEVFVVTGYMHDDSGKGEHKSWVAGVRVTKEQADGFRQALADDVGEEGAPYGGRDRYEGERFDCSPGAPRVLEGGNTFYWVEGPFEIRGCQCSMAIKMVGDGCDICNPARARDYCDE